MSDPLIRLLSELPPARPDPVRAERTRMCCRTKLARRARAELVSHPSAGQRLTAVWRPLIAVLGVAYVTDVIIQAIRLYGAL